MYIAWARECGVRGRSRPSLRPSWFDPVRRQVSLNILHLLHFTFGTRVVRSCRCMLVINLNPMLGFTRICIYYPCRLFWDVWVGVLLSPVVMDGMGVKMFINLINELWNECGDGNFVVTWLLGKSGRMEPYWWFCAMDLAALIWFLVRGSC